MGVLPFSRRRRPRRRRRRVGRRRRGGGLLLAGGRRSRRSRGSSRRGPGEGGRCPVRPHRLCPLKPLAPQLRGQRVLKGGKTMKKAIVLVLCQCGAGLSRFVQFN